MAIRDPSATIVQWVDAFTHQRHEIAQGHVHRTARVIALLAACAWSAACGGFDPQKFAAVSQAGNALQQEVQTNGGQPRSQARDRLKQLETEVAALSDRTIGKRENDVLQAYADAADAYRIFLRFRGLSLGPEAENGRIPLKGPDLQAATRYKLPVDRRDGVAWVNSAQAVTIMLQAGEQHLSDGNRLVTGAR